MTEAATLTPVRARLCPRLRGAAAAAATAATAATAAIAQRSDEHPPECVDEVHTVYKRQDRPCDARHLDAGSRGTLTSLPLPFPQIILTKTDVTWRISVKTGHTNK
jgi:hypothetical protein